MLVHICCSVDSHYFLSELKKIYPNENLIGYFYNPNIHPKSEHDLRLNDVRRSCEMLGIQLFVGEYEINHWSEGVKGLEDEPEKGKRCVKCFDIRLEKTAQFAKSINETLFTSTLLSSPMKEQEVLYEQGDLIAQKYDLEFIKINVRKNGGVEKQNILAKKDNLYRQNYCGCKFALHKQREKQDKFNLEMISDFLGKNMPGSIESRLEVFAKRDELEKQGKSYKLLQVLTPVWRNIKTIINNESGFIKGYVLANTESKNFKIKQIDWQNLNIKKLAKEIGQNNYKFLDLLLVSQETLQIGFSKNDDTIFIYLDTDFYKKIKSLSYEDELNLRDLICGIESKNAIIFIDEKISNATINIESITQNERLFKILELN